MAATAAALMQLIFGDGKTPVKAEGLTFPFTDQVRDNPLSEVYVRFSTDKVEGIKTVYANNANTGWHGTGAANEDVFKIEAGNGEAIVAVLIWGSKGVLNAIQFETNHGYLSKKFGGSGGELYILRADPDSSTNPKLRPVTGFVG
ncbi:hypothetical protein L218DRAFT_1006204 [Marasmius fiardii PR-910]|nr:hypothetical protein L218DRAFT_1006204 [Marasmius fiardii PR-910]